MMTRTLCGNFLALVLACVLAFALTLPARAEEMVTAEVRPGWRLASGEHVAALHLRLAPGWKTYWRVPGDAGIPPVFSWRGSQNLESVRVHWPTPGVFFQSGMRSIGYKSELVLPLVLSTRSSGSVTLSGSMDLGLCKDICIPHSFRFRAILPVEHRVPDAVIAAAMADVPYSEDEAQVRKVTCAVRPRTGGLTLRAVIDMPKAGGTEVSVIEAGNPLVWVSEPTSQRNGSVLEAEAHMMHVDGAAFALDRSAVRITVIGDNYAVDIRGCD